jgi:hypothetical protein
MRGEGFWLRAPGNCSQDSLITCAQDALENLPMRGPNGLQDGLLLTRG